MFIDPRHKVFGHLDRLAGWQAGRKPAPVTVEWDLSNRCSLGCMDCHFAHTHVKGPWTKKKRILPMAFDAGGDLADLELVKRGLKQMAMAGVLGVIWSGGGEPTTHPRLLEVLDAADRWKFEQGMYTLGGLLTKETGTALGKVAKWVVVSLDAADAKTYAHDKNITEARFTAACNGISYLVAADSAAVGVSFLLHSDNWQQAAKMANLARQLGATYTLFRPTIRTSPDNPSVCDDDRSWITEAERFLSDLSSEEAVELDVARFLEYRDWKDRTYSICHGIKLTATITPDGRVWLCPQRRGCQNSCIGDLRIESFQELWGRHTGEWTDFKECRVMCRLHLMNQTLSDVYEKREHEAFL